MPFKLPPLAQMETLVDNRILNMMEPLVATCRSRGLAVEKLHNSSHFCPFTGGGDIIISKDCKATVGVLMSQDGEDEDNSTVSPKSKEVHVGAIEGNCRSLQSDDDTIGQLKANMLLSIATKLQAEVEKAEFDPSQLSVIKCYGITLPLLSPIALLTLAVDFENRTLNYSTLLKVSHPPMPHIYADGAIEYVLSQIAL